MSRTVRSLAVLALVVWFLAGTVPVTAAPLDRGPVESLWTAAWEWLAGLFAGSDAGCTIDPDGKPNCAGSTAHRDAGAAIDPDGLTAGAAIDPNG